MFPRDSDVRASARGLRDRRHRRRLDGREQANFSLNKWIADGKVFTTTPDYRYNGKEIGEVKDGWVLVGAPGADQPVARQGMQSEWIYNRVSQHTLFRQASARMVVLYAPQALAWGTAY
jgi:hypothetical protein